MKNLALLLISAGLFLHWISKGFEEKNYPSIPTGEVYKIDSSFEEIVFVEDTYPGRKDKTTTRKYNDIGLPIHRGWLTSDEWKGKHLSSDKKKTFKNWKENYMKNFIKEWKEHATEEYDLTGIPPGIIVAQAILESNWGTSRLAKEANNFFGHKQKNKTSRAFIIAADDSPKDKFTVYESKWWCLRQHSKILNGRYKKRLKGNTIKDWIEALCGGNTVEESKAFVKNGGKVYATSCYKGAKCYGEKLLSIIKTYNLYKK